MSRCSSPPPLSITRARTPPRTSYICRGALPVWRAMRTHASSHVIWQLRTCTYGEGTRSVQGAMPILNRTPPQPQPSSAPSPPSPLPTSTLYARPVVICVSQSPTCTHPHPTSSFRRTSRWVGPPPCAHSFSLSRAAVQSCFWCASSRPTSHRPAPG
jgi:hypothetical protein